MHSVQSLIGQRRVKRKLAIVFQEAVISDVLEIIHLTPQALVPYVYDTQA